MKHCLLLIAAALAVACSTRPVPGVCCRGPEDCSQLGLSEDRPCPAGQACVEFQCVVPSCSTQGCAAEAPVCDVAIDVCTGCTDASDCSRFPGTDVCDPQTGSCVECLVAADCTTAEPVCDGGSCRGCRLDTECPSGACGEDGACVPEANIVYLHPNGIDAGLCSRDVPCRRIQFGATKTSASRNHIVLAAGTYDLNGETEHLTSQSTSAQQLFIHGGGARLRTAGEVSTVRTEIDTVIRDLEIISGNEAIDITGTSRSILERIQIRGGLRAMDVRGAVVMRDVSIEDCAYAILLSGGARLTLERGIIKNTNTAIQGDSFATVDVSNLLVFGATDVAIDLANAAGGTVSFTTIADSGADAGSGPRAFRCPPSGLTVRSSIIWAPGTVARPAIDAGCTLASTIVGPTAVPGAPNVDPRFVDAVGRDYHLAAGSPARDAVDAGPAMDFEGDPRPRGARFDLGADEAP
ncbi:MAG TPA: choice-of-anchor Q domain-containing protein [Kofleriaceae bacterium]|nr:choice-of-anchor Q domain-containing protein [Kofleriaceae bacterium]